MNIRAFFVSVTEDAATVIDNMAAWVKVDPAMIAASPFALVGTVNSITETLLRRRDELGFSYVDRRPRRSRVVRPRGRRADREVNGRHLPIWSRLRACGPSR